MSSFLGAGLGQLGIVFGVLAVFAATHRVIRLLTPLINSNISDNVGEITKDHAVVTTLRSYTEAVPSGLWPVLTYTAFAAGYLIKTVASPANAAILVFGYVLSAYMSNGFALTLIAAYQISISVQAMRTCKAEFDAFLALGPGGTPSTISGFKRVTLLGWFGRINVLEAPNHTPGTGFLAGNLPTRQGTRPIVGGIAPQRQVDQRGPALVFDYLLARLDHFSAENTAHLRTSTSFLEKCTQAILANCDSVSDPLFRTFGCEITHPHHVDGSLHVMLDADDIATVIAAGFGERHPLARDNPVWTAYFFATESRPPVPANLAFIYAPRTHAEVSTVMRIVEAGADFVAERNIVSDGHKTCPNHHPRS